MVDTILRQHGTEMMIYPSGGGDAAAVRAFFQPVQSKSWQNASSAATPLGVIEQGQYVYIGPAATAVTEGDALQVGDCAYVFRRVEPYYYGGSQIYLWGLCIEKGVNDIWGSQS